MPKTSSSLFCGATKSIYDINSSNHLKQFIIGLNDTYDHDQNQILIMDLLASIKNAYSMILRVVKQHEVHVSLIDTIDKNADGSAREF